MNETPTITKFTLTISPDYCEHWELWEALRELLQNAIDQDKRGYKMKVYDTNLVTSPCLTITNTSGPKLDRKTLLLGYSDKRDDDKLIGKFGEGYKLALLVLCRLGYKVQIQNHTDLWTPALEYSEEYGCHVLTITVEEGYYSNEEHLDTGVAFHIYGCEMLLIGNKYRPDMPKDVPVLEPDVADKKAGLIYVEGLYVTEAQGFRYDYNFSSPRIKLDRDRGMVDGFELAWQTSQIWATEGRESDMMKLIEDKAPDVAHVEYHALPSSFPPIVAAFRARYQDAIPVSTQEEIKQATAAGKKWQLVPDVLKNILWRAVGYFIPTIGTPQQRLRAFIDKHKHHMTKAMVSDLEDILGQLS